MIQKSPIKRIADFDALRSIAILYIVGFWHLCNYSEALSYYNNNRATLLLTLCIIGLFAFVSGYLLSKKYSLNNKSTILGFYIGRFLRVYPLFLIALTAFFLFSWVTPACYLKSIFLTNMFLDEPLRTLWFISMFFILYMITPLFLYNYSNKKTILLTFLLWAGFIAIHFKTSYIDLRLPQYLIPFSAGIITARSASLYNILKNKYVAGASFIFFLVVLSIYPLENELTQLIVIDVAVLASIPSFIFLGQYLIKILSPGLLWFVAYSSYCLYLFHRLTYSISIIVFQPTGFFPSIIYLGFIILPTTLILCFIIQRCYDVIFQGVKNKF